MSKSLGVVVGINEYGSAPLNGCVNDINAALKIPLIQENGFEPNNTRMLTDKRATTEAIIERLEWMVKNAAAGDKALFYYSGHGAFVPARGDSGEVDGMDEVLCPVDFNWEPDHMITDNQLASIFAKFDPGVRFVMITDCCHSGTLTRGASRAAAKRLIPPADIAWRMSKGVKRRARRAMRSLPYSVHISGCRDDQTSADAWFVGTQQYRGALSYYLEQELVNPRLAGVSVEELVNRVRNSLIQNGFDQVPQVSGNVKAPLWGAAGEAVSNPPATYSSTTDEEEAASPYVACSVPHAPEPCGEHNEKVIAALLQWHTECGKSLADVLSRLH